MMPSCYSPPLYAIRCYAMKWKSLQCNVCNGIMYIYTLYVICLFMSFFNYIHACCMRIGTVITQTYILRNVATLTTRWTMTYFQSGKTISFFDASKNNKYRSIPELVEEKTHRKVK